MKRNSCGIDRSQTRSRRLDVTLRLNEDCYFRIFNCLGDSFFGDEHVPCGSWDDVLSSMELYSQRAANFRDAVDVENYFKANQMACLYKKLSLPQLTDPAKDRAIVKWLEAEASCKEKNAQCWEIFSKPLTHSQEELASHLEGPRREILNLLGEVPPDFSEVMGWMKFGPGATLSHHRPKVQPLHKMVGPQTGLCGTEGDVSWLLENTSMAECFLASKRIFWDGDPSGASIPGCDEMLTWVDWVDYAKLDFVPKNTREMRTIEVGPSLAVPFQQAYDGFIRKRLKDGWGIDLSDQSPNWGLCRMGSLRGDRDDSPCTLDLSAASDRISYGIVATLLPKSWTRTLAQYRAKRVTSPLLGEGFHTLEKFSSMGNCFTFSLQTLIYAAVVRSVLRERGLHYALWRTYGDDIIVPRCVYHDVVLRLETLGFKVNEEKSFSTGFFRESCGVDYLRGTNVRALYIKEPFRRVANLYTLLNSLQIIAYRAPIPAATYEPVFKKVLALIPKHLRVFGEPRNGLDSCIWSPSLTGSRVLRGVAKSNKLRENLAYLLALYTGYEGSDGWNPLKAICPHRQFVHDGPIVDHVIRRASSRGLAARLVQAEDLPFDPILGLR